MTKVVFFDIDGTLLDDDKNLPPSAYEAVMELKKKGVYVAFATGRAPFMMEQLRKELEIDSFIAFNGQYVVFENEVIYKNPMEVAHLQSLRTYAKSNGHPLIFMNEETMKSTTKNHAFIKKSLQSLRLPYPDIHATFYDHSEIYQTLVFCTEIEEEKYVGKYHHFDFIRWHPYSLDVLPSGGSKAAGIMKMIERLDVQLQDVYAFGDGLNDIEMLKAVGTGVAMGNAVDEVKRHADCVTKHVSENGIYRSLKSLQLI